MKKGGRFWPTGKSILIIVNRKTPCRGDVVYNELIVPPGRRVPTSAG